MPQLTRNRSSPFRMVSIPPITTPCTCLKLLYSERELESLQAVYPWAPQFTSHAQAHFSGLGPSANSSVICFVSQDQRRAHISSPPLPPRPLEGPVLTWAAHQNPLDFLEAIPIVWLGNKKTNTETDEWSTTFFEVWLPFAYSQFGTSSLVLHFIWWEWKSRRFEAAKGRGLVLIERLQCPGYSTSLFT